MNSATETEPLTLSKAAAARRLGVGVEAVDRMIAEKRLVLTRLHEGARPRVTLASILANVPEPNAAPEFHDAPVECLLSFDDACRAANLCRNAGDNSGDNR